MLYEGVFIWGRGFFTVSFCLGIIFIIRKVFMRFNIKFVRD